MDTSIQVAQAKRLRRLRTVIGYSQQHCADLAGISRDAWGRMERWKDAEFASIDGLALARFLSGVSAARPDRPEISADYVLFGRFTGLPAELTRELVLQEAQDAELDSAPEANTGSFQSPQPSRKKRRKNKACSDT